MKKNKKESAAEEAQPKIKKPFVRVMAEVNDVAFGEIPVDSTFIIENEAYASEVLIKSDLIKKHDKRSTLNALSIGESGKIRPYEFADDVRVVPVILKQIRVKRNKV